MVSTQYFNNTQAAQHSDYVGQIVIRPNNSMGWQTTRYFLATLMIISLTMATAFFAPGLLDDSTVHDSGNGLFSWLASTT